MAMDRGRNKSLKSSEFIHIDDIYKHSEPSNVSDIYIKKEPKNQLTLSDLINRKPKREEYEEVVEYLVKLAKETYESYKFLIAKSSDETKEGHFLQLVSNYNENPKLHKKIFSKAMDYGVNMQILRKLFASKVAKGDVIDLGEDIVVITNDGELTPPTGVSPINSGLEGGEIAFIITFVRKENYEEWLKNNVHEGAEEA